MTQTKEPGAELPLQVQEDVTIRFAGDSGDGMQITGNQFTSTSAVVGNDLATFPDFPAEIRAPAGTRPGVSGFQLHFSSKDIHTPGDRPDALVAMNPAALVVNIKDLKPGGIVVVNEGNFGANDLKKAKLETNPIEDGTLEGYRVIVVDINKRVAEALADSPLSSKEVQRCKNFYTLGLMYWLYSRPLEPTMNWLAKKFAKRPELVEANQKALQAGYNAGDIHEMFQGQYQVPACNDLPAGTYRNILGNQAIGLGLVAGAAQSGLDLFLGAYPITPATDILQQLAAYKNHNVMTFQAEDEIAAVCATIGAAFCGKLAVTSSSGPGIALKTEALGLAVSVELPMVIVNVQRAGPSTGMPTKVEQADLYQSIFGRNGEAPIPVVAASSPADAFDCALEACRIALEYMTPVFLLSDNYIANGSEPWKLPRMEELPKIEVKFRTDPEGFQPFLRDEKLRRPWALPGTPGLEHRIGGLEKEDGSGNVCYDPQNHQKMTQYRQDKVLSIRDSIETPGVEGPESGDLLVLGWGGTKGSITSATNTCREAGLSVANMHLRHLWPLPNGLDAIFGRYKAVLIPEINMGQLWRVLRSEYPEHNFLSYPKVQGKPFMASELVERIKSILEK
ncbi:MAG TPA: 2-oxoacid:acceptor oxidoreductase subunit alpha [Planctomycetes bacterium]|nr:2-oxoacid:acceptor oxidoreductase subunit alpha [Planctomycetota bacterium]